MTIRRQDAKEVFKMTYDMNREIQEARSAGIRALNSLRKAQQYLNSARNWGIMDILGGGFLSTLLKHAKLEDAQRCVEQAQDDLRAFSRELRDVDVTGVQLDGFLQFADFFFDGFLADFMVQSRINEARGQIERACRQVEDILRQLNQVAETY